VNDTFARSIPSRYLCLLLFQFKATLREQQTSSSSAYLADVKSLEDGVEVWKIPRSGDAKKTKLYLKKHRDQWEVSWDSHKRNKDEAALKLSV